MCISSQIDIIYNIPLIYYSQLKSNYVFLILIYLMVLKYKYIHWGRQEQGKSSWRKKVQFPHWRFFFMKVFVLNLIPFCISIGGGIGGGTGPLGGDVEMFLTWEMFIWLEGSGKPPNRGMGSQVSYPSFM